MALCLNDDRLEKAHYQILAISSPRLPVFPHSCLDAGLRLSAKVLILNALQSRNKDAYRHDIC